MHGAADKLRYSHDQREVRALNRAPEVQPTLPRTPRKKNGDATRQRVRSEEARSTGVEEGNGSQNDCLVHLDSRTCGIVTFGNTGVDDAEVPRPILAVCVTVQAI